MHKLAAVAVAVSTAVLAAALLNSGAANGQDGGSSGGGGSSNAWPTSLPLATSPGTLLTQSSTTAVVRSTDVVSVLRSKLDNLYVTQKGCTLQLGVNKPRDYLCYNPATNTTDEVLFTFAALDSTADDPSLSQTNAFYTQG